MKEWLTANATMWTTLIVLLVLIVVNVFTKWVAALKRHYFEWGKVFEFLWTDIGPKFLGYFALLTLLWATEYMPFPGEIVEVISIAVAGVYFYLALSLFVSLVENLRELGLPISTLLPEASAHLPRGIPGSSVRGSLYLSRREVFGPPDVAGG